MRKRFGREIVRPRERERHSYEKQRLEPLSTKNNDLSVSNFLSLWVTDDIDAQRAQWTGWKNRHRAWYLYPLTKRGSLTLSFSLYLCFPLTLSLWVPAHTDTRHAHSGKVGRTGNAPETSIHLQQDTDTHTYTFLHLCVSYRTAQNISKRVFFYMSCLYVWISLFQSLPASENLS